MIFEIPPRNPYGKDLMASWEGFLTPEEINFILAQPEWLQTEDATVGKLGGGDGFETNTIIRKSQVGWVYGKQEMLPIWHKLSRAVAEVNRRYFHLDLTGFYEPMQLGIYSADSNGHYNWHVDIGINDVDVPRKLSMSLLLSDPSEFEGGEFQVKTPADETLSLEQARGKAWFFPSYVTHRVTPVTKGVRRSLVLWVGGPAFR
jgi:PKHD-type hydroxylase